MTSSTVCTFAHLVPGDPDLPQFQMDQPDERTRLVRGGIHRLPKLSGGQVTFPKSKNRRADSFPFDRTVGTPDSVDEYYDTERERQRRAQEGSRGHVDDPTSAGPFSPSAFSSSGLSSASSAEVDDNGVSRHHAHDGYHGHRGHRHHGRHKHHLRGHQVIGRPRTSNDRKDTYEFGVRQDGLPKFSRQCLWSEIKCYGSYILPPLFVFGVLAIGSGLIFVAIKRHWI